MVSYFFVLPEENWFLETAVEAAQINVKKHGGAADLSCFAEIEKVVFEELITFHGLPLLLDPRFRGDDTKRGENERGYRELIRETIHHIFTTLGVGFWGFRADDN